MPWNEQYSQKNIFVIIDHLACSHFHSLAVLTNIVFLLHVNNISKSSNVYNHNTWCKIVQWDYYMPKDIVVKRLFGLPVPGPTLAQLEVSLAQTIFES